nr:MAG TPA: zinc-ribbon domain protein [Caudoviricetes sp.]
MAMVEYIDKNATVGILEAMSRSADCECIKKRLEKAAKRVNAQPTADVAPVVYGRWIRPHWKNNNYCCDCSECGGEAMHRDYQWHKNGVYPICPNCGAKMDGVE